jgi:hypothetical protein
MVKERPIEEMVTIERIRMGIDVGTHLARSVSPPSPPFHTLPTSCAMLADNPMQITIVNSNEPTCDMFLIGEAIFCL